ncbi:MAG: hypothetical protein JXR58_09175, partial [Bacteroidales bacterium]|nr:hypothetical protein [Bacteroidales bacterium]
MKLPPPPSVSELPVNPLPSPDFEALETDDFYMEEIAEKYYGQRPMYCQSIVYDYEDNDNEILFFIVDNNIYNKNGISLLEDNSRPLFLFDYEDDFTVNNPDAISAYAWNSELSGYEINRYNQNVYPGSEVIVVPIPGSCYEYYLIYTIEHVLGGDGIGGSHLYIRKLSYYDESHIELSNITCFDFSMQQFTISPPLNIGISDFRESEGNYLLFVNFNDLLLTYEIDENTYSTVSPTPVYTTNLGVTNTEASVREELECLLVQESDGNMYYYIAMPFFNYVTTFSDSYHELMLIKTNINGEYINKWTSFIGLDNEHKSIKGLEFSENGKNLFFTYYNQDALYYLNTDFMETGAAVPSYQTIPIGVDNPASYQISHVELGRDNKLYYQNAALGTVSSFSNPNNPSLGVWETNIGGINNCVPARSFYDYDYKKHYIFADQIDGSNYEDYYYSVDFTCCQSHYFYDTPREDISHMSIDASSGDIRVHAGTYIWTPENNPFHWETNDKVYLDRNLVFEPGSYITIRNMTFKFEDNVGIKIQHGVPGNGGTLVLNNTLLTSYDFCGIDGQLWKGIEMLGSSTSQFPISSTGQPRIYMINGATIEYAQTGIYANNGAIIRATQSNFRDNNTAIKYENFNSYTCNSGSYINQNASYVNLCNFTTTNNLYTLKHSTPYIFAHLRHVSQFKFNGNRMINQADPTTIGGVYNRGHGIIAFYSKALVNQYCFNIECTVKQKSRFENLDHGIKLENGDYSIVNNCDFERCLRGLQLKNNSDFVEILQNNFRVYNLDNDPAYTHESYGLSIENSTLYTVEENQFYEGMAGAFAINTGTEQNKFYHNHFHNLSGNANYSGLIGTGENSNWWDTHLGIHGIQGLRFICNKFENNDYALAVIDGSIAQVQVGADGVSPANNWFDHISLTGDDTDFYVEGTEVTCYNYLQAHESSIWNLLLDYDDPDNQGNTGDYYTYDLIGVNKSFTPYLSYSSACPSNISSGPIKTIALQIQELQEKENEKINMQTNLDALTDGGNTPLLLSKVEGLTQSNYFSVCADLLEHSGYLSDAVLQEFMNNTLNRPVAKTAILLVNSPLPTNLQPFINETNIPELFKWLLWQMQTGVYPRELEQWQILALEGNIDIKTVEMSRNAINDTIIEKTDSVIQYLETRDDLLSQKMLTTMLIETSNYALAVKTMEDIISQSTGLNPFMQEKIENWVTLMTIQKTIEQNPVGINEILHFYEAFLIRLGSEPQGYENSWARALLNIPHQTEFTENYPLPSITKSGNISKPVVQRDFSGEMVSTLYVYPNPANNLLQIEYISLTGTGSIKIFDMQ